MWYNVKNNVGGIAGLDKIIENLLNICENCNKLRNSSFDSFLSVLNRRNDEDLISRIIAYILSNDKTLIVKMLNCYSNNFNSAFGQISDYDIVITPEKTMGIGRADIFVEIKNKSTVVATITIENKIYSYEHDNQTQTYYKWVTSQVLYKHSINTFFYLRPYFNKSEAVCKEFKNISYTDLLSWISKETDDYIIKDFCKHIEVVFSKTNLEDIPMLLNEEELYILNNYEYIKSKLDDANGKFKRVKDDIIAKIEETINNDIKKESVLTSRELGIGSYRLYKNEWNTKEWLFYVEIKFCENPLNRILLQETIYENNNSNIIKNFIEHDDDLSLMEDPDGRYYVIRQESIPSNTSWEEENWHNKLIEEAIKKLPNYIEEMDRVFNKFCKTEH